MLRKRLKGLEALYPILNQDGFIGFIQGRKDKGKTDVSLLCGELCYLKNYRRHIATNIHTESYMVEAQITNVPDLKHWLEDSGRKLFILDEAGKHLRRMGFMSKMNQAIMELVQLIRHFDTGLICISPAQRFIDSGYLDPDVIDFVIKKVNREYAKLYLTQENRIINLFNVPRTSIKFNSKDIADFTLEKKVPFQALPECCQVAAIYAERQSYEDVQRRLKMKPEAVKRKILEHIRHTLTHDSQPSWRIGAHESEPQP